MLRIYRPHSGPLLILVLLLSGGWAASAWTQPVPEEAAAAAGHDGRTNRAGAGQPQEVVAALHNALLRMMKQGSKLRYQDRYRMLKPVIGSHFDIGLIAEVVLGRHWNALDGQQKTAFIKLLEQLTTATYAARFDDYNGETFALKDIRQLNQARVLVRTVLQPSDEEAVTMDYILHDAGDGWQVISVIADGVNDLALKRAEYAGIMERRGFDGLVTAIRTQIEKLQADS